MKRCEYPECGCDLARAMRCSGAVATSELVARLRAFERRVADAFEAKRVRGPIHLSGGNERALIDIFKSVHLSDWVFTTYRSHYHALLHGVPEEQLFAEICAGRSMTLCFPERRFYSSAIVGGCLPIAVGAAAGVKRHGSGEHVWCFVGDMAATTGAFHEATRYARGHDLPITFVVEDNGLSCDTPTAEVWGRCESEDTPDYRRKVRSYSYKREGPHVGTGKWVAF